eukprot:360224-Chlamydomonas_euryale.AAC.8
MPCPCLNAVPCPCTFTTRLWCPGYVPCAYVVLLCPPLCLSPFFFYPLHMYEGSVQSRTPGCRLTDQQVSHDARSLNLLHDAKVAEPVARCKGR